jgi:hypothetical protein
MHCDNASHATVGNVAGAGVIVTFGILPDNAGAAHTPETNMPIMIRMPQIPVEIAVRFVTIEKSFFMITIPPSRYPEIKSRGQERLIKICKHDTQSDLHGE